MMLSLKTRVPIHHQQRHHRAQQEGDVSMPGRSTGDAGRTPTALWVALQGELRITMQQ